MILLNYEFVSDIAKKIEAEITNTFSSIKAMDNY